MPTHTHTRARTSTHPHTYTHSYFTDWCTINWLHKFDVVYKKIFKGFNPYESCSGNCLCSFHLKFYF